MEHATLSAAAIPAAGSISQDFPLGQNFEHRLTRTVTQMDNMLFSNMTLKPAAAATSTGIFCEQETEWGKPLMNSLFTLGLMIGISVNDLTVGTTIANLGMTEVKFPHPPVRRRYRSLHHRSAGQAGIEFPARSRHRRVLSPRLQSGRQAPSPNVTARRHAHAAAMNSRPAFGAVRCPVTARQSSPRRFRRRRRPDPRSRGLGGGRAQGGRAHDTLAFPGGCPQAPARPAADGARQCAGDGLTDAISTRSCRAPRCDHAAQGRGRRCGRASRRQARRARGDPRLPDGEIRIVALATETASALFVAGTYGGASGRLTGLSWGAEDLSADLGAETNRDAEGRFTEPFRFARNLCLAAAAAAKIQAIDTVFVDFRDLAGLKREAEEARRDGFTAKLAIHPAQVQTINEVFTPSPAAIATARAVIAAFAEKPGAGVVRIGGVMYEPPASRARQTIAGTGRGGRGELTLVVMAGLVPAIHAFDAVRRDRGCPAQGRA